MSKYTPEWRDGCPGHYHDTYSAYRFARCRCPAGIEDYRLYQKRCREGRLESSYVPGTGTARRLHALMAIGWSSRELSTRYDGRCAPKRAAKLANEADESRVTRRTAVKVKAIYDELHMQAGPSTSTRAHAAQMGWAPPMAWDNIDDPTERPQPALAKNRNRIPRDRLAPDIIEAAFDWRKPRMSYTEQRHVVDTALDERGMTTAEVALMLGLSMCAVRQTRTRSNQARSGKRRKPKAEIRVAS